MRTSEVSPTFSYDWLHAANKSNSTRKALWSKRKQLKINVHVDVSE
jgi:hypothetical protein